MDICDRRRHLPVPGFSSPVEASDARWLSRPRRPQAAPVDPVAFRRRSPKAPE